MQASVHREKSMPGIQAHRRSLPSNALLLSKRPEPCHDPDAIRPRDTPRRAPALPEPILQYVSPPVTFVFRPFRLAAAPRPPAPRNDTHAAPASPQIGDCLPTPA